MFNALVVDREESGLVHRFEEWSVNQLPDNEVLVETDYAGLNYQEGLAISGRGRVLRSFPIVPGSNLAGHVVESSSPEFKKGDAVILTGGGLGERYCGGFAGYARVESVHVVRTPTGLSGFHAMALGSPGLGAMMAIAALEQAGITPSSGKIAVSLPSGGLGSIAVLLLRALGYEVVAVVSGSEDKQFVQDLGVSQLVELPGAATDERPLEQQSWAAAIDNAGGDVLPGLLSRTGHVGCVVACGLVSGHSFKTSLMPFLLRGVSLLGIDAFHADREKRSDMWRRLLSLVPIPELERITKVIRLDEVPDRALAVAAGGVAGRTVVDVRRFHPAG